MGIQRIPMYPYPESDLTYWARQLSRALNQEAVERIQDFDITKLSNVAWKACRAYSSFENAISNIGSTETILLVQDVEAIADNVTIPSTMTLRLVHGGSLSIASGKTVTMNGHIEAGLYQIFEGAGTVAFGAGAVKEVYPQWWGENTTPGTTDMTAAIQAAINTGLSVFISPGTYKITSVIDLASNMEIRGEYGLSILQMAGGQNGIVMFRALNDSNIVIQNLVFDGNKDNVSNSGGACLQLTTATDVWIQNCEIKNSPNIGIYGTTSNRRIYILNNYIHDNGKAGASSGHNIFFTDFFSGIYIKGNWVGLALTSNIMLYTNNTATSYDVFIEDNYVTSSSAIGIYISGDATYFVRRITIANNISVANRDNILIVRCHSASIVGNVCSDSVGTPATGDGIVVQASDTVTISGNICYYNKARGILICKSTSGDSYRITITGNTVYDNNQAEIANVSGIDINDSHEVVCTGNYVASANGDELQEYNIACNASCDNLLFVGNMLLYPKTANWNLLSTAKRFNNNTDVLSASPTWNPGSIAAGSMEAKDVTVTGAVLGDFAQASFSLDITDLVLDAKVTAADTVTCVLSNNTAGAVDLASGTIYVRVTVR